MPIRAQAETLYTKIAMETFYKSCIHCKRVAFHSPKRDENLESFVKVDSANSSIEKLSRHVIASNATHAN